MVFSISIPSSTPNLQIFKIQINMEKQFINHVINNLIVCMYVCMCLSEGVVQRKPGPCTC